MAISMTYFLLGFLFGSVSLLSQQEGGVASSNLVRCMDLTKSCSLHWLLMWEHWELLWCRKTKHKWMPFARRKKKKQIAISTCTSFGCRESCRVNVARQNDKSMVYYICWSAKYKWNSIALHKGISPRLNAISVNLRFFPKGLASSRLPLPSLCPLVLPSF